MKASKTIEKIDCNNIIVQPFPIHFNCNDYHIILFLKDHPEYEAVEAMIKESGDGPFIRAIITCHDQSQIDHINNYETVKMLKNKRRNRKVCYTPIHYVRTEENEKMHLLMRFTSYKREDIALDFYAAAKASHKHCDLIDPLGHSIHVSLPIMRPEKTTLAASKSKAVINGITYKAPVKVWIPFLFKGMKGFYSELFHIGVLRAGNEHIKVTNVPTSLSVGEKWVYTFGKQPFAYEITNVQHNNITLQSQNETVEAEIADGDFKIKKISVFSTSKEKRYYEFFITFNPGVLISPITAKPENGVSDFSISIDRHLSLITGKVHIERKINSVQLLLIPSHPEWAAQRPVLTKIRKQGDVFILDTKIDNE